MSIALECRAVCKRFTVGVARCSVRTDVLRGVDFELCEGEAVAIVGERGAGKSTLMLCAAGLLKPDVGEIKWYRRGCASSATAVAAYHWTAIELERSPATDQHIRLIDFPISRPGLPHLQEWLADRCMRGDAVLLATRDETLARALCSRVLFLERGYLSSFSRKARVARVAEPSITPIEPPTRPR